MWLNPNYLKYINIYINTICIINFVYQNINEKKKKKKKKKKRKKIFFLFIFIIQIFKKFQL